MTRELTGRDVFLVTATAFGVIIAVNVTLAVKAVGTFPGLEVANSYVASQTFDAEAAAQARLGWEVDVRRDGDRLVASFPAEGGPVAVSGLFGRSTIKAEDRMLAFTQVAPGRWEAEAAPARGRWVLHLAATAPDGTPFRRRISLVVD
jgi:nitrogen fixation protein FixH